MRKHPGSKSNYDRGARFLPKICAADVEVGNFITGIDACGSTCELAARAVLSEIAGVARDALSDGASGSPPEPSGTSLDSRDWGRTWLLTNGGCCYIDLSHLELCLPECRSAYAHTAAWHAMLRIARRAQTRANAKLPEGQRIEIIVNCSDGKSNSYGAHQDYQITREAWDNLFKRRLHYMLFLASHQVSSIILTGQGKVGAENGRPKVDFQISQRADFFHVLQSQHTTFDRPLCNSRREFHSGDGAAYWRGVPRGRRPARLHCIFYDSVLCHAANILRTGMMQIVLAMVEGHRVNPGLIVEDPVHAVSAWSHDPSLRRKMRMASGKRYTAVELQMRFAEEAREFAERHDLAGIVPGASSILALWQDSLDKFRAGATGQLIPRVDWLLKKSIMEEALRCDPSLSWDSHQLKYLDHLYASLDPRAGLFWQYESGGVTERLVREEHIEALTKEPPSDTRAWSRAMILRRIGQRNVRSVNWDCVSCRDGGDDYWSPRIELELPDPAGFTRANVGPILERVQSLGELHSALCDLRARGAGVPIR